MLVLLEARGSPNPSKLLWKVEIQLLSSSPLGFMEEKNHVGK